MLPAGLLLLALTAARHVGRASSPTVVPQRDPLRTEKVAEGLHVIYGNGGNTAVWATDSGAVVVDSKFEDDGPEIIRQVRTVTDQPIRFLVTTHHHTDHSYGNAAFPPETVIVAHPTARQQMLRNDFVFWKARERGLPKELVDGRKELLKGDDRVEVLHLGRGHTAGDLVVIFPRARAAHLGDLFVWRQAPGIDLDGGGSAKAFVATMDKLAARKDIETFIPGHGEVVGRAKFLEYVEMWRFLHLEAAKAVKEKRTQVQFLNDLRLDDFSSWKHWQQLRDHAGLLFTELSAAAARGRKK